MGEGQRKLVRARPGFQSNCKAERITPKGEHGGKSQERNGFPKYDHEEYLEVLVLELGHNQMLLGIDWLNFHNPEVNWSTPNLQFTHCPKHCSRNASQFTIRWTTKTKKQSVTPPNPDIDENGLSKGIKPNYIKPFQHLFKKKNFDRGGEVALEERAAT